MKLMIGFKANEEYCGVRLSVDVVDISFANNGITTNPKQHW